METIENFIEEINSISKNLHRIERTYNKIYKEFEGVDFKEQNRYASEIDNSILTLTHEIGSHLVYERDRLQKLLIYIDFRKKHKNYNDDELEIIIDKFNEINIKKKKELLNRGKENITLIISEWNKIFTNQSYLKIKEILRIQK